MMKAAVYSEDGSINLINYDMPELQPGWLQLAVSAVGICGTDLHIKHGALGSPKGVRPGHEIAGVIEAIGDSVDMTTGTAVVVEPVLGCGKCQHCQSGSPNRCGIKDFFGYSLPGGMAELIQVPESIVYPMDAALSSNISALSEPMAVCVRGARRAKIPLGARVAILGAGSIGLLSILSAYAAGANEIFISARYTHQQELALHFGATRFFKNADELLSELGDQYVDVVIETVGGTADTLTESVQIARTGATILMLGAFKGSPAIPALRFLTNELSLVASNCHGHEMIHSDFKVACDLVKKHHVLLEPMITHRFKLDQIAKAFATAEDKNQQSIKIQVNP
jgi:threonine dehydrogenase-like Zn-dependent dehydrogenase